MTSVFLELLSDLLLDKHCCVSMLSVLSASFKYDNYVASDVLLTTTLLLNLFMRSSQAELIIAAVSWLVLWRRIPTSCCMHLTLQHKCLEYAQVRPGTHSFPAKWATLAGCYRPVSVYSLRSGVQTHLLPVRGPWHFPACGPHIPLPLFPSLLFLPLLPSIPLLYLPFRYLPLPSLPLEVGPFNPARRSGGAM